jgi:hypothetical protein
VQIGDADEQMFGAFMGGMEALKQPSAFGVRGGVCK